MVRLALLGDADRADQLMKLMLRLKGAKVTVRAAGVNQLGADHDAFDAAIMLFAGDVRDCEQLVAAGKHLLVPITCRFSTRAIQALSDQCQQHGLCLMVGGTDRLVPSLQAAWQSLAAGVLGERAGERAARGGQRADHGVEEEHRRLRAPGRMSARLIPTNRMLLAAGADVHYRRADGTTALDLARASNNQDLEMLLVQAGAAR